MHGVITKWQLWLQLFRYGWHMSSSSTLCRQCTTCVLCGCCLSQFQNCVCVSGLVCLLAVSKSSLCHSKSTVTKSLCSPAGARLQVVCWKKEQQCVAQGNQWKGLFWGWCRFLLCMYISLRGVCLWSKKNRRWGWDSGKNETLSRPKETPSGQIASKIMKSGQKCSKLGGRDLIDDWWQIWITQCCLASCGVVQLPLTHCCSSVSAPGQGFEVCCFLTIGPSSSEHTDSSRSAWAA